MPQVSVRMSALSKSKAEFLVDMVSGSIAGSVDDILRICRVIRIAKESLTPMEFKDLREDSPFSEKVWSKLLQVGLDDRLEGIKQHLPPLYTTIHLIHCLTDEELESGVREGQIHPKVTQGSLNRWIRHVRFQGSAEVIPEDFETLVQVMTPPDLSEDILDRFKGDLDELVSRYGFRTRYEEDQSMMEVRQQRSQERSQALIDSLSSDLKSTWEGADSQLTTLFSFSSLEDLVLAPISAFTGFLNRVRGGREAFWSLHGTDYIRKIALEYLRTTNKAQRFNYRRRLKKVAEKYPHFAEKVREALVMWMKY